MWFSPPLFWDRACRRLCRMGFWELAGPSVNRFCFLLSPHNKLWGTATLGMCWPWERAAFSWHHRCSISHWKATTQRISLLLLELFISLCIATGNSGLVSFWKLFGNKEQTQSGVVRWGCDLSPPETWVPSRSRGWWSLPSQHRLVFNAMQPYGIWEQHYIDPRKDSAAQCMSIGLWGAMHRFPAPPIVSDLVHLLFWLQ